MLPVHGLLKQMIEARERERKREREKESATSGSLARRCFEMDYDMAVVEEQESKHSCLLYLLLSRGGRGGSEEIPSMIPEDSASNFCLQVRITQEEGEGEDTTHVEMLLPRLCYPFQDSIVLCFSVHSSCNRIFCVPLCSRLPSN